MIKFTKLAIITGFSLASAISVAHAEVGKLGVSVKSVRTVDADTISINNTHKVRLLDIDAPEIFAAGLKKSTCPLVEKELGLRAAARTKELTDMSKHRVTVQYKGGKDNYGRNLGNVFSDGKNIGSILVSEGLALPWKVGKQARPTFCLPTRIRLLQHKSE